MQDRNHIYDDKLAFRVWDIENECYQQDDADDCSITKNGRLNCVFWGDGDTLSHSEVNQDKAVIERSTGLRDKNGNLIYEGDILKSPHGKIRTVKWVRIAGCFMAFPASYSGPILGGIAFNVSEIIGNIHEYKGEWK